MSKTHIDIRIDMNRFGHLEIDPVSERLTRKWRKIAREGKPWHGDDCLVYVKSEDNIESALENLVPKRKRGDVWSWGVRVRVPLGRWEHYVAAYNP